MISAMPVIPTSAKQPVSAVGAATGTPAALRCFSRLGALLVALGGALPAATADQPVVGITGGVQPDNRQFYEWTITNGHTTPIVFIEFSQYHGDTFMTPAGWSQEWKNQSKVGGGKDAPGWVRTSAANPSEGISPGSSARFGMRLARAGAMARPGRVIVRFADGSEVTVADVELPSAQSLLEQNVMLIGLAAIFIIALLIHFRRGRKTSPDSAPSPPAIGDEK